MQSYFCGNPLVAGLIFKMANKAGEWRQMAKISLILMSQNQKLIKAVLVDMEHHQSPSIRLKMLALQKVTLNFKSIWWGSPIFSTFLLNIQKISHLQMLAWEDASTGRIFSCHGLSKKALPFPISACTKKLSSLLPISGLSHGLASFFPFTQSFNWSDSTLFSH